MSARIGMFERVENKGRRFGAAKYYWVATVLVGSGKHIAALTDAGMKAMLDRGAKNPEDVPVIKPNKPIKYFYRK